MIVVNNLKLRPGESEKRLQKMAAQELGMKTEDFTSFTIYKKSLDARRKNDIHFVYAVALTTNKGSEEKIAARSKQAVVKPAFAYDIPKAKSEKRPVVVGFGPGGMFAALLLTKAGLRPIVLERGGDVDSRQQAVDALRTQGILDPENNVQFGEGGAGTFSDGKLNTNTHDPRIGYVLREFVAHGAKPSIVYDNKPHIGTDVLVKVVRNIRQTVIDGGGEVRFGAKVTGLRRENGRVTAVEVNGSEIIEADDVILAIGHSARDTFTWLHEDGVHMTQKAFSMGVRIEHLQDMVDRSQYGMERGKHLPPVSYNLNVHLPDGGSAYTFCMCPGGYVFAAASEEGGVCTNGMSYSGRGGSNANSALLVTLMPEDFPSAHVLSGMEWQRDIERAAYAYGGGNYCAPCQLVGDFLANKPSKGSRSVKPTYEPGVIYGDLREILPQRITSVMQQAIPALGKKLRGFDHPDAVLTGPETRSSSPVRIVRGEDYQSLNVQGLYPCGEGAGYAGGITSAAVDGIRCAEAVIGKYKI